MESREPRSRANKMRRNVLNSGCQKPTDRKTCPRCGHPCHSLVRAYYESPWNEWGGICCECAIEAATYYDRVGWPAMPEPV